MITNADSIIYNLEKLDIFKILIEWNSGVILTYILNLIRSFDGKLSMFCL